MATWITHFRIAENILKVREDLDIEAFVVGNIGPDSGVPNEDWSNFDPPKIITHWYCKNDKSINSEGFFSKYLEKKQSIIDKKEYSFLLGYYTHLLTDIEWGKIYKHKKETNDLYRVGLENDPDFIWTIKKDWYGLDFLYLEKNPQCIFYTVFKNIETVPDYLEYFPKDALTISVNNIRNYYLSENDNTKENFIYLSEEELDRFVIDATNTIKSKLKEIKE